jgi:beta-lactam-binding protein with PASTA domain
VAHGKSDQNGAVVAETLRTTVRARFTRLVVVLAVLASVLVVAFGTGYRASQAVVDDGSAYLVKGRSITHINAETGRSDADVARELAKGDERLQVVQTPSGQVYVVSADGTTTKIDLGEMAPAQSLKGTPGKTEVLGSGSDTYYVDRGHGTVELFNPDTMAAGRSVPLPHGVTAAVATSSGRTLWVLSGDRLLRVVDGVVVASTPVGNSDQRLTLVGNKPVLVDGGGTVRLVENDKVRAIDAGLPAGDTLELNQPGVAGSTVWVADEAAGNLVGINVTKGQTTTTPLGSGDHANLGPSVTLGGRVYVPDYTGHVVRVVSAGDGTFERTIPVTGTSTTFDLFVEDGRVWINDPAARTARVLDGAGRGTVIDKGAGHGVKDPGERPPAQPPVHVPVASAPPGSTADKPGDTKTDAPRGASSGGGSKPADPARPAANPTPDPGGNQPTAPAQPAAIDVPNTVGQPKDQACATLQAAGLGCSAQGIGTQQGVPPDQVVSSSPAAGEHVAAGTIVTVQYAGAVTVPDLAGRTPTQACDELLSPAGLACNAQPSGVAPDGQPVNAVNAQDPAPGTQVAGGSTVTFNFFDKFRVADYTDQQPAAVCQSLSTRPITCKLVDLQAGPRGSKQNVVVEQSLPPGDYAAGQTITVGFYTGENGDPIPNVVGQQAANACAAMANAGYNDCAVVESPTPSNQVGIALTQSEPAGSIARSGKHVEITQETTVPDQICRYRRPGESVWVVRVGCNNSGVADWEVSNMGHAYAGGGPVLLYDNICSCGGRVQHQITAGSYNPEPGWDQQNGTVGTVFDRDYGGMVQLVRLIRPSNDVVGQSDYTYALMPSADYDRYTSLPDGRAFHLEGGLGWVWP